MQKTENNQTLPREVPLQFGIGLAFCLCFLYWNYLYLTCDTLIKFDAIGYQELGRQIYQDGWIEYFRTGPNREPLYPFLISLCMRLGELFSVPYLEIQKIFQFLFLFMTQLFTLLLLNRTKVNDLLKALVVIYIGFSPALINSALSLMSEIMILPFVLVIIDTAIACWEDLVARRLRPLLIKAFVMAAVFTVAIFIKGVFFNIMMIFLGVFLFGAIVLSFTKPKKVILDAGFYALIVFLTVQSFIVPFKLANQTYNGQYTLTNRYMELLFGNTYKRTKPLDRRGLLAHVASVPGGGVCRAIFTEEECQYCEFQGADYYRMLLPGSVEAKPEEETFEKETLNVMIRQIKSNPVQYAFLTIVEASKIFFWESTQLGFVNYPPWMQRLYNHPLFSNGIRLVLSLLSIFSVFCCIGSLVRRFKSFFEQSQESEEVQTGIFILIILVSYTGLYSLFSILTRYAVVLAPLFLIMLAITAQRLLFRKNIPS